MKNRKQASATLSTQSRRPSRRRILASSAAAMLGISLMMGSVHAAPGTQLFWDPTGAGAGLGGPGTWDLNPANLSWSTNAAGTAPVSYGAANNFSDTVFNFTPGGAAPGAVAVSNAFGAVGVNTITFVATGYSITGGPLIINAGTGVINLGAGGVGNGVVATIAASLADTGVGNITVNSSGATPGTLQITGANTFNNAFVVNSGTVTLNTAGRGISGTALTIGDGVAGNTAVVRDINSFNIAQAATFNTIVTINSNGTLDLNGNGESVGSIASSGAVAAGSGLGTINLGAGGSITTGNLNTNAQYNGTITGTGAGTVTKAGTGTWTLTSSSNFTGTTNVTAGALSITNGTALGAAGNTVAVTNNATLQVSNNITTSNYGLTLNGAGTGAANQDGALVNIAGTNNYAGAITLGSASTISSTAGTLNLTSGTAVAGAFVLTLNSATAAGSGSIAGSLNALTGLTKAGGGTWTLNGNNAGFAGPINVTGGTLQAGLTSTSAFGNGNVAVTLTSGGLAVSTLDVNGTTQTIGLLNGGGGSAGTVVTNSNAATSGTLVLGNGGGTPAAAFQGTFTDVAATAGGAGSLNLTKTGAGTFTLDGSGTNTYHGVTTINGGTLLVTNTSATPLGTAGGTAADGTVVTGAAASMLQLSGGVNLGNEALSLAGVGSGAAAGALNNLAGTNVAGGPVTLTAATTIGVTAGQLTVGSVTPATAVAGGGNALTLTTAVAGAKGILASSLTNTVSSLTVTGAGTWVLGTVGTVNTGYTNAINLTGTATLQAGVANAFGAGTAAGSTVTLGAGTTLDLNGFNNAVGALLSAAPGNGTVTNTGAPAVTLTVGAVGAAAGAGNDTFSGVITNTGGALTLTKVGAGTTLTLTGANSYTGATNVTQGILIVGNNTALGTADGSATTGTTVTAGATVQLNAGITVGNERLAIAGTGAAGAIGALQVTAGTGTWGGPIVLSGAAGSVTTLAAAPGATLTLTGGVNKAAQTLVFFGGGAGAAGGTFNVNTVGISGTDAGFTSDMVFNGGTTNVTAPASYTGKTWLTNGAILNANVVGALPAPAADGGIGTQRTGVQFDAAVTPGVVGASTGASTLNLGANQAVLWIDGGLAGSTIALGANVLTMGLPAYVAPFLTTSGATPNFAGIITSAAGAGGILKDGNNTQILSGANTYTGTTTVVNGKLQAGSATAFGVNSNTTVGTAATLVGGTAPTLELAGFNITIGSLSGNATGFVQNNFGAVGSNATLTLNPQAAATSTFLGVIQDAPAAGAIGAGTLSLVKNGVAGSVQVLGGLNTYTGTTTVNTGTLRAGIAQVGAAGSFGTNSAVTVNAGGTLDAGGVASTIGNLTGAAGATDIVTNSVGTGTLTINTQAKNAAGALVATQTAFGGFITNGAGTPLNLVINDGFGAGTGVQSISNNTNNYTGTTTVNAGATLDIDSGAVGTAAAGALGAGGALIINGGANIGTSLAGAFTNSSVANPVTVNGSFNVTNVTPLVGGAPVINGPFNSPAGTLGLISAGVTFTGPVTLAGAGVTTITTKSGWLDIAGAIGGAGSGGLTFAGNTFTWLTGGASNTYGGVTTVGDFANNVPGTNYVLLGKTGGTVAIPGNLVITPNGYVQFDPGTAGVGSNQINPNASVVVNGTLDTAGLNQAVNQLTGVGTIRLDTSVYKAAWAAAIPNGAGVLTVNSGLFAGSIIDGNLGGQLVKNSVGKLILTGNSTYVGNTTINGGILQVDGSILSRNIYVNPAGTLQGIGSVGGNVFNNGTVKPGDSPGTLTVRGNYNQSAGGNLRIELNSTTNYGRLQVGGQANLNGTLTAVSNGGFRPKNGDTFTVLTAAAGVNGKFSTFNDQSGAQNTTLRKFTIVYDPNDVKLQFTQAQFSTLASAFAGQGINALTPNQTAVARNLDRNLNNPRLAKVIDYLDNLRLRDIPAALDRIAPEEIASIYNTEVALSNVQTFNLQRRTADARAGSSGFSAAGFHMAGSGPDYTGTMSLGSHGPSGDGKDIKETKQVLPEEPKLGVFLTGVGEWVSIGNTFNARGYDLDSGGFTLGVDYKITPTFLIGLDAGYAHTNGNLNNGGRLDVDGGKLGVYASYFPGDFYLDTAVTGGYNSYGIKRAGLGGTTFGDTDGGNLNVLAGAGYMFHAGGLSVGPTGTFQYTYMGLKHFTEHGSVAPQDFPGQSTESIRTAFGAKASYDWKSGGMVIRPEVAVSWQHEYGDTAYAIDSSFAGAGSGTFTVHGPEIGRDSLLLQAGVAVQWNERTSTYVYYDGEFGRSNYSGSNVSGGIRVSF